MSVMRWGAAVFLSAALLLIGAATPFASSYGQALPDNVSKGDYVHTYARPGEPTETVYVWGAVDKPGVWEIAPDTDLVELFSVVRPTNYGVETPGTRRRVVLRILRVSDGQTHVAHEVELRKVLEMAPDERPSLEAEDVVEVRTVESRAFGLQIIGTVVGTLSSVALLVMRITRG